MTDEGLEEMEKDVQKIEWEKELEAIRCERLYKIIKAGLLAAPQKRFFGKDKCPECDSVLHSEIVTANCGDVEYYTHFSCKCGYEYATPKYNNYADYY